nr:T9SS type A sorting domain-containing protein [Bacteroidota bacterium]
AVNTSNDPPSPPVLIFPDSVIVESLDLIFNWNPSYDPDPYDKISYHILWTYQHLLTDSVTTDSCFCVVNNLIENGRYTWYVNANDQNGGNSQSRQRPFWVDAIPEPPKGFATISPANESAGLGSEIAFIWQESIDPDPFDLVKYDIVYTINTDDSSTYEYISEIADTTTTLNLTENGVYYWKILAYDKDQFIIPSNDDEWYVFTVGNVAIDGGLLIPVEFALHSNYPNPFNPTTTIRYDIPKATNVTLTIYNMNGQVVGRLVNQKREPGYYSVNWDAQNVSTGVYFYQIRAEGFQQVKKCLLIK